MRHLPPSATSDQKHRTTQHTPARHARRMYDPFSIVIALSSEVVWNEWNSNIGGRPVDVGTCNCVRLFIFVSEPDFISTPSQRVGFTVLFYVQRGGRDCDLSRTRSRSLRGQLCSRLTTDAPRRRPNFRNAASHNPPRGVWPPGHSSRGERVAPQQQHMHHRAP